MGEGTHPRGIGGSGSGDETRKTCAVEVLTEARKISAVARWWLLGAVLGGAGVEGDGAVPFPQTNADGGD